MAKRIELNVNGTKHTIEAEPDMPLLYACAMTRLKDPRSAAASPNAAPAQCW